MTIKQCEARGSGKAKGKMPRFRVHYLKSARHLRRKAEKLARKNKGTGHEH